jgi:hypothetical protein
MSPRDSFAAVLATPILVGFLIAILGTAISPSQNTNLLGIYSFIASVPLSIVFFLVVVPRLISQAPIGRTYDQKRRREELRRLANRT